ncbi:hypothetical protein [Haloarcula sp. JP-L23]|uniref:hypothetical protein n=1 Tax=Haloarcula sp. JP-L23 TaxID=2716717 RepID=UPI00140EED03|nr:hypothetical protein G9465_08635 [Haloarcula sp. JP-L23]
MTPPFDNDDNDDGGKRVRDEEGSVDQKLKDRIIAARNRVDEREDSCFVEAPLEGVRLKRPQLVRIWSTAVKQYLRAIEPLLRSEEVENSTYYYRKAPVVEETLYPPDGKYPPENSSKANGRESHNYRWSLFYRPDVSTREAIASHQHNQFSRAFAPPEPKEVTLHGLYDVLETNGIRKEWAITTNPDTIPPEQNTVYPTVQTPLRREWLEKSVRIADEFLQQAGISIDVGYQSEDDPDESAF